jgi:hypothetical protein
MGWGRAATRLARRKLEGPRAATRSREADMVALQMTREIKCRAGRRGEAGNWRSGELDNDGLARGESFSWFRN